MFGTLRKGTPIYVLKKEPTLSVETGEVAEVSAPAISNPITTFQPGFPMQQKTSVDVKAKLGEQTCEFKQLPTDTAVFNYFDKKIVVSDSKDEILREIESMRNISADALASVDKHKEIVSRCDELMAELNPHVRRAAESAKAMQSLNSRVDGLERSIGDVKGMLSELLKQKK